MMLLMILILLLFFDAHVLLPARTRERPGSTNLLILLLCHVEIWVRDLFSMINCLSASYYFTCPQQANESNRYLSEVVTGDDTWVE